MTLHSVVFLFIRTVTVTRLRATRFSNSLLLVERLQKKQKVVHFGFSSFFFIFFWIRHSFVGEKTSVIFWICPAQSNMGLICTHHELGHFETLEKAVYFLPTSCRIWSLNSFFSRVLKTIESQDVTMVKMRCLRPLHVRLFLG